MIEAIADWTIEADQLNNSETVNRKSELRIVRDAIRKIIEADCSFLTDCRSLPNGRCGEVTTAPGIL
jgi:hypothetical protein